HLTLNMLNTINLQTIVYTVEQKPTPATKAARGFEVDTDSVSPKFLATLESTDIPKKFTRPTCAIEMENPSDEVLTSRMQRGDREALAVLFRNYAKSIRNLGAKILRDDAEADDLVQEVFLYLHRKSALFDGSKGSARSWIFQIAYTQAFIRRRKLK